MKRPRFAEEMHARMKQLEISGVKLSKLTQIDPATISNYVTGKRRPTEKHIELIASALEWPLQDALHAAGRHKPHLEEPPAEEAIPHIAEITVILRRLEPPQRFALGTHLREVARSWVSSVSTARHGEEH